MGWELVVPSLCCYLKSLRASADIRLVRKSALITGLLLVTCSVTPAGTGTSAARNAESAASSSNSGTPSDGTNPNLAAMKASAAVLPVGSEYLPAASPGYTLRREIPEVHLQFTVTDSHGLAVRNLSAEDIQVFDGQAQVLRFNEFERDEDLPLEIGVLLDNSDSVRRVLPEQKTAAARFLARIMRAGTDSAFVMGFGGDVKLWQGPTGNLTEMVAALGRMNDPGWGTRLYDALYAACDEHLQLKHGGTLVHRAIILLTDGDDTASLRNLSDAIGIALRNEVQIYTLTIRPGKTPDRGDQVLQRIADSTGGRMYVSPSSRDLDNAFAQIEQDLRTQYRLSFSPQQPLPGYHSVRLHVQAPAEVEVHARQGYFVAGR